MNEGGRLRLNSVRICADCIYVSRLVSLGPSPCHLRTGRNAKQDSSSSTQPELVLISTLQLCSSCGFCAVLGLASPDGETSACENAVHDMLSYPTQEPVLLVSSHPYGILVCRNLGDWFVPRWRRGSRAESEAEQRLRGRRESTMGTKGLRAHCALSASQGK